jgi:hypothetical protein
VITHLQSALEKIEYAAEKHVTREYRYATLNEDEARAIAAALNSVERVNAQAGVVEALEFYADPRRYHGPNQSRQDGDRHTPVEFPYMIDVTRDSGDIARAALAAVKGPTA